MEKSTGTFDNTNTGLIKIIDSIRQHRNETIKYFLDERNMIAYLTQQYKIVELTTNKIQSIKKDLKDLLITPVDIELYKSIINQAKSDNNLLLDEEQEKTIGIHKEIETILKKHLFN